MPQEEKDLLDLEFLLRFQHLLQALRLSWVEWNLISVLIRSDTPISENSLSLIMRVPRTTIRGHIDDHIAQGFVRRDRRTGIELTPTGRKLSRILVHEGLDIVRGERTGFQDATISMLMHGHSRRILPPGKRAKPLSRQELKELRFAPALVYDVEIRHPDACTDQVVQLFGRQSAGGS